MAKVVNHKDRLLQLSGNRVDLKYRSPDVFVRHSTNKVIIEDLVNTINTKARNRTKNDETIKGCNEISCKVEEFLQALRHRYASSIYYTNDFQWVQELLSSSGEISLRSLKNRLLLGKFSPLINKDRYVLAKQQLEDMESGVIATDIDGFKSMATAFLEVSQMKYGRSQGYFIDLQRADNALHNFMLSQDKTRPRKNNARRRYTNLSKAIIPALESLGKKPSFDELWDYFQKYQDDTGYIHDFTDTHLTWVTTKGKLKDTSKGTVQNMLSKLNYPL